jgi:hypothetical protein
VEGRAAPHRRVGARHDERSFFAPGFRTVFWAFGLYGGNRVARAIWTLWGNLHRIIHRNPWIVWGSLLDSFGRPLMGNSSITSVLG